MNAFGIAVPSPFRFRFRLDDGFLAGFLRLNALDCIHYSLNGGSISLLFLFLNGGSISL
jgi:hypothetical protein